MHEAKLYDRNCFITLTYDNEHMPDGATLYYPHYVAFMRRLRKYIKRRCAADKVRFYMCGEYGSQTKRPHYHACLFGYDFADKLYFKKTATGPVYTSRALAHLWPMGSHLIGSVTFESAAYVARYCVDKVTGDLAKAHYEAIDRETGEVFGRAPEFNRCSTKPGIGGPWLKRFLADVYPNGHVVVAGQLTKAPRYYDKLFKRHATQDQLDEFAFSRWKDSQKIAPGDNTDERILVKEELALARLALKRRSI